ncbi:FAD-dependent oxidoreductase [Noviherbaspirillum saxi]|uniref:NADH:flavin oxidoreductase n=1 Tax=Noviherbaspirillum saxi TaxID=2320863 RepID=A0A3A3FEP8_9BURK|nr:FAD-dependent oxidoreductase [Noviherbaspirillum saxi]RJF91720.1 NADH:flavin oxidoreductase [Noviherbaspirillum saxi]
MPQSTYPNLFSQFQIGKLALRNRVVMAPMSTNLSAPDGSVTPAQVAFYRARAEGGTGMIIVEFCCVDAATGRSEHRQLSLEKPTHLDGHQRLVEAIKSAGAAACLQLQHGGQGAKRELVTGGVAVAPSDVPSRKDPSKLSARALTEAEIEYLIECFGRTAELGVKAGYDAFELHGAHGYLLTSFISPMTNHRTDAWGGDEDRRLNFSRRVIQRVKQAIGDRPLIYRFSADEFHPKGLSIDDMERIAPKLVAFGADALHVSIGTGWTSFDKVVEPMSMPEGWRLPYARRIRKVVDVPVIGVGQIRWPATAERAVASGDADLIALGRTLLADPEWANKAQRGDDAGIRPCTSCNYCVTISSGEHGYIGCAENPRTGHELDAIPDAGRLRGSRAVIIGGGPGGMAAALMLDQAGFKPELYETRATLGGGLIASAAPPFKEKLTWYQHYLESRLAKSSVKVMLNTRADMDSLAGEKPSIVVMAVGGRANRLPIEGIDVPIVHDAYEVLMGDSSWLPPVSDTPVVVYGGGETGCETAEFLSERGYPVILVSRSPAGQLARAAEVVYRSVLRKRLAENRLIRIVDSTSIVAIEENGAVHLQHNDGSRSIVKASRVLVAQGRSPDTRMTQALLDAGIPVVAIGDARTGGRIGDAVHQAYAAVNAICATQAPVKQLAC